MYLGYDASEKELLFCVIITKSSIFTGSDGFVNAICHFPRYPPPTAQTDHHKDLKFGMDTHLVPNRGAVEAIFDKWPQSRFMGQGWGTPGGRGKNVKIFFF